MKRYFLIFLLFCIRVSAQTTCDNEDFELSSSGIITASNQVQGWTNLNGSSFNVFQTCSIACSSYTDYFGSYIVNGGNVTDNVIGNQYPLFSVFGASINAGGSLNPDVGNMYGNSFLRLASNYADYGVDNVFKTVKVTENNTLLRYAYIFVGTGYHSCCEGTMLRVSIKNVTTNSILTAFSNTIFPPSSYSCATDTTTTFYVVGTNSTSTSSYTLNSYSKWRVMNLDLSPYLGDSIKIDFIATDCYAGGHFGYAYLDAECRNIRPSVNGTINATSSFTVCNSATLSAASHMNYLWNGPTASGITNFTTQNVTATVSGVYTLSLFSGTTAVSTQTVDLYVGYSFPITVTAVNYTICSGGTSTLMASSPVTTYSWNGVPGPPVVFLSPTVTTIFTVTATNSIGCLSTGYVGINVFPCTAIKENENGKVELMLFPNPNKGSFTIRSETNERVQIHDNLGRLLQTVKLTDENGHVQELSGFKPGIYFIRSREKVLKMVVSD